MGQITIIRPGYMDVYARLARTDTDSFWRNYEAMASEGVR